MAQSGGRGTNTAHRPFLDSPSVAKGCHRAGTARGSFAPLRFAHGSLGRGYLQLQSLLCMHFLLQSSYCPPWYGVPAMGPERVREGGGGIESGMPAPPLATVATSRQQTSHSVTPFSQTVKFGGCSHDRWGNCDARRWGPS